MLFKDVLAQLRKERNLTQAQLAMALKISPSAVSMYEQGRREPDFETEEAIARFFKVDLNLLRGISSVSIEDNIISDEKLFSMEGIIPAPEMQKVPRLGEIACGIPIFAQENIDNYDNVPKSFNCTFTLQCKGDSMINARILNNDIVMVHSQPMVENGEIAAVLIGEEATLKRVYKKDNQIILSPENPAYPPIVYTGDQLKDIKILGKAVGFISRIK